MHHPVDKNQITSAIRKLGVIERLDIISDIWDEIKESKELEAISEDEKKLLLGRLANYKKNPGSATDWSTLKEEIYHKYDKEG